MIEGVTARLGRLNKHPQIGARLLLPNELRQGLRADRRLEGIRLFLGAGHKPVGQDLFVGLFAAHVKKALATLQPLKHKTATNGPGFAAILQAWKVLAHGLGYGLWGRGEFDAKLGLAPAYDSAIVHHPVLTHDQPDA